MIRTVAIRLAVVSALVSFAACKKDQPADRPMEDTAPARADETAEAPPPADDSGVDVCALLTKEEASAALGAPVGEPQRDDPQGSMLGGCSYTAEGGQMLMTSVMARPAREWEDTVKTYSDLEEVSGVGESARYSRRLGMLVKVPGKDYFLQVMVQPGNSKDVVTKVAQASL